MNSWPILRLVALLSSICQGGLALVTTFPGFRDVSAACTQAPCAIFPDRTDHVEVPISGGPGLDLVLLLSNSGAHELQDWARLVTFSKQVLSRIPASLDNFRLGVMAPIPPGGWQIYAYLNYYYTVGRIVSALHSINHTSYESDISRAVDILDTIMFTPPGGDRPSLANVVLVLSVENSVFDFREADLQLLEKRGVAMFSMKIPEKTNYPELSFVTTRGRDRVLINPDDVPYFLSCAFSDVCGPYQFVWTPQTFFPRTPSTTTTTTSIYTTRRFTTYSPDTNQLDPLKEGNPNTLPSGSSGESQGKLPCDVYICPEGATCKNLTPLTFSCACPPFLSGIACTIDCKKLDLAFVLDGSGSVGTANWKKVLNFTQALVRSQPVGRDAIRVGVVTFGNEASVHLHLDTHFDQVDILAAIANTKFLDENTNTSGGIRVMRTQLFSPQRGDRPEAANIGIIMTDGNSTYDANLTIPEAEIARSHNIRLFAIGVTNSVNQEELVGIAGDASDVSRVENFDALKSLETIIGDIIQKQCVTVVQTVDPCLVRPCPTGWRCHSHGQDRSCRCPPGFFGDNCTLAVVGKTGARGDPGVVGKTGSTGRAGLPGPRGAAGPKGAMGGTGATGPSGPPGATGQRGPGGPRGPLGSVGPRGSPGPAGSQGLKGDPGDFLSVPGSPGQQGIPGATGATGSTGSTGSSGLRGIPGRPGELGLPGPVGYSGATGATGPSGSRGNPGTEGGVGGVGPPGPPGFSGLIFEDSDQCMMGSHECQQVCVNLRQGFRCECFPGYDVDPKNKMFCKDIDECLRSNGGCQQLCHNEAGGHRCSCGLGFTLSRDTRTCLDVDECCEEGVLLHDCNSSQLCINTYGSYHCMDLANPLAEPSLMFEWLFMRGALMHREVIISYIVWASVLTALTLCAILLLWYDEDSVLSTIREECMRMQIMEELQPGGCAVPDIHLPSPACERDPNLYSRLTVGNREISHRLSRIESPTALEGDVSLPEPGDTPIRKVLAASTAKRSSHQPQTHPEPPRLGVEHPTPPDTRRAQTLL